ncbi:MAG: hypothetical protein EXR69_01840 [Myxococcales bacterium]|nr:hypothetical protein [Myxococcales bacterium]
MDPSDLRRAAEWRLQSVARRANRARHAPQLRVQELTLTSSAGYEIAAQIVRIDGAPAQPGLVVSPGIHQGLREVQGYGAVVNAGELAGAGYTVLVYDPAGRGLSWGEEDFGGPEHQDDVRVGVRALQGSCSQVGLLSLSLGVAAAVGAASRWPELGLAFVVDWEGPCDREIITAGGSLLVPAAGHSLSDDAYWNPREAVRQMAGLSCPYIRLQALPDHAQPAEVRHAMRMAHAAHDAASRGTLPWFQLNDHARGEVPARPLWLPGGPIAANIAIRRKLRHLRDGLSVGGR